MDLKELKTTWYKGSKIIIYDQLVPREWVLEYRYRIYVKYVGIIYSSELVLLRSYEEAINHAKRVIDCLTSVDFTDDYLYNMWLKSAPKMQPKMHRENDKCDIGYGWINGEKVMNLLNIEKSRIRDRDIIKNKKIKGRNKWNHI